MKIAPKLEWKLTEAALRWPRGKPGLEEELKRIAKKHEEFDIAWRRMWPLLAFLCGIILLLVLLRMRG